MWTFSICAKKHKNNLSFDLKVLLYLSFDLKVFFKALHDSPVPLLNVYKTEECDRPINDPITLYLSLSTHCLPTPSLVKNSSTELRTSRLLEHSMGLLLALIIASSVSVSVIS